MIKKESSILEESDRLLAVLVIFPTVFSRVVF